MAGCVGRGTHEPGGVVTNCLTIAERKLAEHRRPDSMRALLRGSPMIPLAEFAKSLKTQFELRLPPVLDLPLIAELQRRRCINSVMPLQQKVPVHLHFAHLRLK